jgi:hypothetical protein
VGSTEQWVERMNSGDWGPTQRFAAGPDTDIPAVDRVGTFFGVRPQLRRKLSTALTNAGDLSKQDRFQPLAGLQLGVSLIEGHLSDRLGIGIIRLTSRV